MNRGGAVLRVLAILIGAGGLIDPVFATRRPQPLRVEIQAVSAPERAVRERLLAAIDRPLADVADATEPAGRGTAAIVVIGERLNPARLGAGQPVSFVLPATPAPPNVRIVAATAPGPVLPGQRAVASATLHSRGAAGKASVIVLEEEGIELARAEHRWSNDDERFEARLEYAPPEAGVHAVTLRVIPFDGESTADDNTADLALVATSRVLRVAAYEGRPSWASSFVRRALEADPVFEVASVVRASRGLEVRGGSTPAALTSRGLERFDAVIVGAPEELSAADVAALTWFVTDRGGAVVLLPDRRPAGPYAGLMPNHHFDEVLLDRPAAILADRTSGLTASELALPRPMRGDVALASVTRGNTVRPVIVSRPHGAGRIVFSGALDAWRYRAHGDESFGRFWTAVIANIAAAAPAPLTISLHPALAGAGESVILRARVRQTQFSIAGDRLAMPPVEARLIAADGSAQPVRLWPAAEPGLYEGEIVPPSQGKYDVQVKLADRTEADAALLVRSAVHHPVPDAGDAAALVSRGTGGIVTTDADLGPLVAHLRGLDRNTAVVAWRPARSPWWVAAFAAALCGEWTLRRRRGLR